MISTETAARPLAEAISYGLHRWEELGSFIEDSRIEIETNTVERSIRPIALNRKSALFAGSDDLSHIALRMAISAPHRSAA